MEQSTAANRWVSESSRDNQITTHFRANSTNTITQMTHVFLAVDINIYEPLHLPLHNILHLYQTVICSQQPVVTGGVCAQTLTRRKMQSFCFVFLAKQLFERNCAHGVVKRMRIGCFEKVHLSGQAITRKRKQKSFHNSISHDNAHACASTSCLRPGSIFYNHLLAVD